MDEYKRFELKCKLSAFGIVASFPANAVGIAIAGNAMELHQRVTTGSCLALGFAHFAALDKLFKWEDKIEDRQRDKWEEEQRLITTACCKTHAAMSLTKGYLG